jgi:flagellar protein FlaJ
MPYVKKTEKLILYVVSIVTGVIIAIIAYFVYPRDVKMADYLITIAIMIALFPAGTLHYFEFRWKKAIESKVPDLLYDIAEAQLSGMSFIRALQTATSHDYGIVSKELRRIVAQIRLGLSLEDALNKFAERTDSELVRKVSIVINGVSKYGGDVTKTIRSLADYIKLLLTLDEERKASMRMYLGIIYISFLVLLVIIVILLNQFFFNILKLAVGTTLILPQIGYEGFRRIFFYATVVQAICSGLVAGKLGEGSIFAGLKHIVIMMFLSLIVFSLIVY